MGYNWTCIIIYLNIVLYSLCFSLQRPLEVFILDKFVESNADSQEEYAKLQSFFMLIQTIGTLFMGTLILDNFGIRGGFCVAFFCGGLSYYILSITENLSMLYLSKVPTAFQHAFLIAQAGISQHTLEGSERNAALGKLTTSYVIGTVIGPSLGGYLSALSGDLFLSARVAVFGSFLSILISLFLPTAPKQNVIQKEKSDDVDEKDSDLKREGVENKKKDVKESLVLPISQMGKFTLVLKSVWVILLIKILSSVSNSITTNLYPLILKNQFKMTPEALGNSMSIISFLNAIFSGFFIGKITEIIGSTSLLIKKCLYFMCALSIFQAISSNDYFYTLDTMSNGLGLFLFFSFVLNICQYLLGTSLTCESTSKVNDSMKGTLLGMEHFSFAATRIFSPQIAAFLFKAGGISLVNLCCGFLFFVIQLFYSVFEKQEDMHNKQSGEKKDI